jgi:YHS domain-containing protein
MKKKRIVKMTIIILVTLLIVVISVVKYKRISPLSWGMHNKVNQGMFSDEAINGYDPVAYFTQQQAVKGNRNYNFKWNNATWYFSSQENLNLFKSSPEKYAPQFGGYCAFAASKGFTANTDPSAWKIIDDKLYLCSEPKFLQEWAKNKDENLQKSNRNWSR